MSTFNRKSMKNKETLKYNTTINNEGEVVYDLNVLKSLLVKVVGSKFAADTFYKKANVEKEFKELISLIQQIPEEDKEYALKIALLGRYSGMIEYPLNTLLACYNMPRYGKDFLDENGCSKFRYYSDLLVRRTKDVNHLVAGQIAMYGTSIKPQMRKNLNAKLESFDKYKLSKGLDRGKFISLADSLKLLRPTPINEEMSQFYKDVIENKVTVGAGKTQIQAEIQNVKLQEKQKKPKEEIDLSKLVDSLYKANLAALLKNIVMFINYGILDDDKHLQYTIKKITSKEDVLKSKILPYEIYATYKSLSYLPNKECVQAIKDALNKALDISIDNVDDIKGYTAYLIDLSGSMSCGITNNSSISAKEMASLLGAIAYKKGQGDIFVFADKCEVVSLNRSDSILTMVSILSKKHVGGCTYLDKALNEIKEFAKKHNIKYDNLLLLSDNDCYRYNSRSGKLTIGDYESLDSKVSSLMREGIFETMWINNLTGNTYTIANTDEMKKNLIFGFSPKFIDVMNLYYNIRNNDDLRPLIDELLELYKTKENIL